MDNSKSYYEVLGVNAEATPDEIKRAYRSKALKYHPDRTDPSRVKWAHGKFVEIGTAYGVLHNPEKRMEYDEFLSGRRSEFEEPVFTKEDIMERLNDLFKTRDEVYKMMYDLYGEDFASSVGMHKEMKGRHEKADSAASPFFNTLHSAVKYLAERLQLLIAKCIPVYSRSAVFKSALNYALFLGGVVFFYRVLIAFLVPAFSIYYEGSYWTLLLSGKLLYLVGIITGFVIGIFLMFVAYDRLRWFFISIGICLLVSIALMFFTRVVDIFVGNALFRLFSPVVGWAVLGTIGGALFGSINAMAKINNKNRLWVPIIISVCLIAFQLSLR